MACDWSESMFLWEVLPLEEESSSLQPGRLEDRDEADLTELTELFTDYVTEQWVEGDRPMWNYFGPRTTNYIEGWHSKLSISVCSCDIIYMRFSSILLNSADKDQN